MSAKTVKKIKLDSSKSSKKTAVKAVEKPKKAKVSAGRNYNPFTAIIRYVKGSWYEIRQVRWPNRSATWGMTLAVIGFTVFFLILILAIDSIFELLFKNYLLK
ncbi:MAG: preprotein translocase subunit SecE [Candidatus Saccharibacteria bacterium]|nr:preprotein translocase subunit SecE [Candidatus Saccharibacteria bacterium]